MGRNKLENDEIAILCKMFEVLDLPFTKHFILLAYGNSKFCHGNLWWTWIKIGKVGNATCQRVSKLSTFSNHAIYNIFKSEFEIKIFQNLKICQYLRLHMKIICSSFHVRTPFIVWDMRKLDMWMVCLQTFRKNRIC